MSQPSLSALQAALARALPGVSRELRGRRVPFALFLGLLVLAAYLSARLTWRLAAPATSAAGVTAAAAATAAPQAQARAAQIAAAHLFGTAPEQQQPTAQNAPETSLDLTLLGVAAGTNGAPSRAIIVSGGSVQNTYPVGATLPGGAVIRAILPDRVVLAHNGRLENLRLPVAGTSLLAANMSFAAGTTPAPASLSAAQVRRQLEQHPQRLSEFMRLRPQVHNGRLRGYRVFPGQYPELFRQTGLQPGDIVIRVDGINLDNPRDSMRAITRLHAAHGPVDLVVVRHGKPVHLTVSVPGG